MPKGVDDAHHVDDVDPCEEYLALLGPRNRLEHRCKRGADRQERDRFVTTPQSFDFGLPVCRVSCGQAKCGGRRLLNREVESKRDESGPNLPSS